MVFLQMSRSLIYVFSGILLFINMSQSAFALPAFARKENVPCVMCHTNGSAPHLTKVGFLYRRAGFRFPSNIGNREADEKNLLTQYFSAAVNVDYENVSVKDPVTEKTRLTSNHFNLPGIAIFPLVGGFLGNYGAFTELDANQSGVELAIADVRYVEGNQNMFFNFRAGYISQEGYGAGDQWIDDGNLPLIDQLTAQYNQDTLTTPYGAMGKSQLGAELGGTYHDTHLTLGVYNGFDGSNGTAIQASTLTPALMNQELKTSKDLRVQVDQFFFDRMELTVSYYNGVIRLLDPSSAVPWNNRYDSWRAYGTLDLIPNVLDFLVGEGLGTFHWVNTGSSDVKGTFQSRGSFGGFNYYAWKHLTLSGRVDYFQYATSDFPKSARGYALMANLPFENSMVVFHSNTTNSDIDGVTQDFRVEWRFFF